MFEKIVFVTAVVCLIVPSAMLSSMLGEFTAERMLKGDQLDTYWGFWLLLVGPLMAAIPTLIAGIKTLVRPQ